MRGGVGAALATVGLAGCLVVPHAAAVQCTSDTECDTSAGEVCQENVCWGNPPSGMFAASLTAPSQATNLIGTQLPVISVPADGFLDGLDLAVPVTFSGRVVEGCDGCASSTIAAQLTVTTPPAFAGGPSATVTTTSSANATGDSFSIQLAPLPTTAAPYELTITPIDDPTGSASAATLVPPLRASLALTGNSDQTFTLGSPSPVHVTGTLTDAQGGPLTGYDIIARGRWNAGEAAQLVSNVVHTTDGTFDLVLSDDVTGTIDIVATPNAATGTAATLTLPGLPISGSASNVLAQPSMLGQGVPIDIAITGTSADGTVGAIAGVALDVSARLAGTGGAVASLDVQATTGSDGHAQVTLLEGMGLYTVSVIPPVTSNSASLFGQTLDPVQTKSTTIQLPQRVALSGSVVDADGKPVAGMQVSASPSASFLWSLPDAAQAFASSITLAPATTTATGGFELLVDPSVGQLAASYDLQLEPASETVDPHTTLSNVAVVADSPSMTLKPIHLPEPAFIHGVITDPTGNPVMNANLAIYLIISDETPCSATNAPAPCAVPALQEAHAQSDSSGIVRFSLPR
jgi:protocatechuate 3,4-dioxygenase beta subunit